LRIRFSQRARRERRDAYAYYRASSSAAADRFQSRLRAALEYIKRYPEGAPRVSPTLRSKLVLHYPYSVVYEVAGDEILIASIACHYREPERYDS
jgi:plasmid stabilization system protein ParE